MFESANGTNFMTIIDVLLIVYGAYSIYASKKMKSDGKPPQWLVSAEEIQRVRKPAEFCAYMAPKTIFFGFACAVYGIYGLIESFYIKNPAAEIIGIIAFVVCLVVFVASLQKAKKMYV